MSGELGFLDGLGREALGGGPDLDDVFEFDASFPFFLNDTEVQDLRVDHLPTSTRIP